MRRIALAACTLLLFAACKTQADAPAPPPEAPEEAPAATEPAAPPAQEKPAAEVATYTVPEMDDALVKSLIGALDGEKGVVSAKPDTEAGALHVTFEPGATSPSTIARALTAVSAGVQLEKVAASADPAQPAHDCGGCPMRNTCGAEH